MHQSERRRILRASAADSCVVCSRHSGRPDATASSFGLDAIGGRAVADVLLLEDDEAVRVLTESILQGCGHNTLSASTVEQAAALLEGDRNIDLLFTEIGLQGDVQAGLKLAQEAASRRPNLAVLYTSAQAVTDGMRELFADNSAFLPKPYTVEQLVTTLLVRFGIKG